MPSRAKHWSKVHPAGVLGIYSFFASAADLCENDSPEGIGQLGLVIVPP